jgi:hypothetical protein
VVVVLVVAAGAGWESEALSRLGERPGIVVLKRCVDVDDLMGAASSGQADVAVVAIDAPGLDTVAVEHLRAHGVHPVAVVPGGPEGDPAHLRAARIGIRAVVAEDELRSLADVVVATEQAEEPVAGDGPAVPDGSEGPAPAAGRVVAVWGPAGAPGRTTVACGIAAPGPCSSTPTRTADPSPSSSASSTRCPACSAPPD